MKIQIQHVDEIDETNWMKQTLKISYCYPTRVTSSAHPERPRHPIGEVMLRGLGRAVLAARAGTSEREGSSREGIKALQTYEVMPNYQFFSKPVPLMPSPYYRTADGLLPEEMGAAEVPEEPQEARLPQVPAEVRDLEVGSKHFG